MTAYLRGPSVKEIAKPANRESRQRAFKTKIKESMMENQHTISEAKTLNPSPKP